MERSICHSVGGISALFLGISPRVAGAWEAVRDDEALVTDSSLFEEVGLDTGSYAEQGAADDSGTSFTASVSFFMRKDRLALRTFERKYRNKLITAVALTNNGDYLLFEKVVMRRESGSGTGYSDPNRAAFTLGYEGGATEPARWTRFIESQALTFETEFGAFTGNFIAEMVAGSGRVDWVFPKAIIENAYTINESDPQGLGLSGDRVRVFNTFSRDLSLIEEVRIPNMSLVGSIDLSQLQGLQAVDLQGNSLTSITLPKGDWVTRDAGWAVDLSGNSLSSSTILGLLAYIKEQNGAVVTTGQRIISLFGNENIDRATADLVKELEALGIIVEIGYFSFLNE